MDSEARLSSWGDMCGVGVGLEVDWVWEWERWLEGWTIDHAGARWKGEGLWGGGGVGVGDEWGMS